MYPSHLYRTLSAAAFGVAISLMAISAPAQENTDDSVDTATQECLATCREAARDCMFDARETGKLCLEESGCEELRTTYRSTCLVADRDVEACTAARTALKECSDPCREEARTAADACRTAAETCALDECGVEDIRPPRHGHGRPGGPGRRPHRGFGE